MHRRSYVLFIAATIGCALILPRFSGRFRYAA